MEGESNLVAANGCRRSEDPFISNEHAAVSGLPQILDLTFAKTLHGDLKDLFGSRAVTLDAAAVERMSTPCAQVLLAAGRAAASSGISFRILNATSVFRSAIADLGLEHAFSDWMD